MSRLTAKLFEPVNIASMAVFRAIFGLIMFWEALRFISKGWIERYYLDPSFHFKYLGFEWVTPLSSTGMYTVFWLLALAGLMVAGGVFYRAAIWVLAFGWAYVFLLEESNYLNHLYFVILLMILLGFTHAGSAFSADSKWFPAKRRTHVPFWELGILRFQVGVVYFFGGIAKLEHDWLHGMPLTVWNQERFQPSDFGGFFHWTYTGLAMSWAGMIFDLAIVFLLLGRRTRIAGMVLVLLFNLSNAFQFSIGIFPWLMIGTLLLFIDPKNPRLVKLAETGGEPPDREPSGFAKALVVGWVVFSCAMPLRHWCYPGWASWTEEGHRFSWRMKLRDKQTRAHFAALVSGTTQVVTIDPSTYLSPRQYSKMLNSPSRVVQFAKHVRSKLKESEGVDMEIVGLVGTSLNRRTPQLVFDRDVDLASLELSLAPVDWIRPFENTELRELKDYVEKARSEQE